MKKVRTFLKNFGKQPKKIQLAFIAMAGLILVIMIGGIILLITDPQPAKALVLFISAGISIYLLNLGVEVVGDKIINKPD